MLSIKKQKWCLLATMLLVTFFTLTTCGKSSDTYESDANTEISLHVLIPHSYYNVFRQAERAMAREFAARGMSFTLNITYYTSDDDMQAINTRLNVMLMAGQGYDLFLWHYQPIHSFADNGFLTDFYTLIDNHPTTRREDFFINVLEAYEHRSGLYAFPLSFGFEYIGIHSGLPESITSSFLSLDTVALHEIFALYNRLQYDYSDYNHLDMGNTFNLRSASFALMITIGDYIDVENQTASINSDEFVQILESIGRVFIGTDFWINSQYPSRGPTHDYLTRASMDYAFLNFGNAFGPMAAIFDMVEPGFNHFIPLINSNGNLLINPTPFISSVAGGGWGAVCIPAASDGELAWEFVQHLISAIVTLQNPSDLVQHSMLTSLTIPISREYFRPHIESVINRVVSRYRGQLPFAGISGGRVDSHAMEAAIARLEVLSEMPASIFELRLPEALVTSGTFEAFFMGLITAEEAALEMHNIVSLWLIE